MPSAVIGLPDGPIPLEALPHSPQEVQGLRERREILRDQLERATNRRAELVEELQGDGDHALSQEARAGVQQRLNVLDERILQLERDQAMTERQLSNAPPDVLALTAAQGNVHGPKVDEDEAAMAAFGSFGLGVILTLLVSRWRRGRMGRRAAVAPAAALPADPRLDRLTQAVDVIAEEVERIGEGQRFVTQLMAERRELIPAEVARTADVPGMR
jgi:hypothetical protein